ncbi:MAG: hypothetical protein ACRCXH_00285, partial [Shewanella sp.]
GLLACLLAFALILIATVFIEPSIIGLISSYGSSFHFVEFPIWVLPSLLCCSIFLGIIGAWFAVGHHIRATRPASL